MKSFIFTFGSSHAHPNGFVRINAPGAQLARLEMFKHYGRKWSHQYEEEAEFSQEKQERFTPAGCAREITLDLHGYRMRMRPFGLGCQPVGHYDYVEGHRQTDGHHGVVWYERRLTEEEVSRFELEPLEQPKEQERPLTRAEQQDELDSLFADALHVVGGTGNFEPDDFDATEEIWRGDADPGL